MPQKRKNLEAVAALAKCSTSSVSRALSGAGYVSEKLRAKIRAAADQVRIQAERAAFTRDVGR